MALVPLRKIQGGRWTVTRRKFTRAVALVTVEGSIDLFRLVTSGQIPQGSIVRVRPALGEDGEELERELKDAGAGAVRVEPGAVEGMPDLAAPDPDGSPRELALARARALQSEYVEDVVAEVEAALTEAGE